MHAEKRLPFTILKQNAFILQILLEGLFASAITLPTSTEVIFLLGKITTPLHKCKPNILLETLEVPGFHQ